MEQKEIGLYVHIPFCKRKCYYCDFISFADKENCYEKYINCLEKEITKYGTENKTMSKHNLEPEYIIKTIYIGGGTPSVIDEIYIKRILDTIKNNFNIEQNAEITIEVNPGTANQKKLQTYKECGINRISIGLQSTNDEILKTIGRIHTYKDFLDTYNLARDLGFNNINVDLMINLPGQTMEDVKKSIRNIIALKPEHISVYSLILEENTKLYEMVNSNELTLSSDETEREMYWYIKQKLEENKYIHYEISNFAKEGYESKHNLDCWKQKEYIGVGLGASSYMDKKRYSNTDDLQEYIFNIENNKTNLNLILEEVQSEELEMNEYIMLGLRKIDGINIKDFNEKFNQNIISKYERTFERLAHEDLIQIDDKRIKLTDKGIDLANLVWEEFV